MLILPPTLTLTLTLSLIRSLPPRHECRGR